MNRDVRAIAVWIKHGVHSAPPSVVEAASRVLAKPKRAPPKPGPKRKDEKAAARKTRAERMAEARREVFADADGRCAACTGHAEHAHHLLSGSGVRRPNEERLTLAPLCEACHRGVHDNDPTTMRLLMRWCAETNRGLAVIALARRLGKAERMKADARVRAVKGTP